MTADYAVRIYSLIEADKRSHYVLDPQTFRDIFPGLPVLRVNKDTEDKEISVVFDKKVALEYLTSRYGISSESKCLLGENNVS